MLKDSLKNVFEDYADGITSKIKKKLIAEGFVTKRNQTLHKSVRYKMTKKGFKIFSRRHIFAIDTGTKAQNYPAGVPAKKGQGKGENIFVSNIRSWIRAKGITPYKKGMTQKRLAYMIARRISQRGTIKRKQYAGANFLDLILSEETKRIKPNLLKVIEAEITRTTKRQDANNKN